MVHQTNTWLAYVTDDAITIRRCLIKGYGNLRVDDVLVVLLLDQLCNLVNRLAVDENSTRMSESEMRPLGGTVMPAREYRS